MIVRWKDVLELFGRAADRDLHQIEIKDIRAMIGGNNTLDDAMAAARNTKRFGTAVERSSKSGYRVDGKKTKPMRSGVDYVNDLHEWKLVVIKVFGSVTAPEQKVRPCMCCRRDFVSAWKGNRLCNRCHNKEDNGRSALL